MFIEIGTAVVLIGGAYAYTWKNTGNLYTAMGNHMEHMEKRLTDRLDRIDDSQDKHLQFHLEKKV